MAPGSTGSIVDGIVEDTYNVIKRVSNRVSIIEYPRSGSKAFDIVSSDDEKRLFVRVVESVDSLSRGDVAELKASSRMYGATPLIVARYARGYEIEEDVVYEKHGVYVLSVEGLRSVVEKKEPLYVINYKGLYLIRINPERLRGKRIEKGLSLGDLASILGVSRKTVYEYERGRMCLSIEKALRLLEVFGEEVFEPVNVLENPEISIDELESLSEPDTHIEEKILNKLRSLGYTVVHLKRAPVDVIGCCMEGETISIVIKHYISSRGFRVKVGEAEKIARIVNTRKYVVREESDLKILFKEIKN